MKKYLFISEDYLSDFERRINELSKEGWLIIPESLRINYLVASTYKYTNFFIILSKEREKTDLEESIL